jgi:RNA polymerase sigma-70 factor (ECF subfamily)
MILEHHVTAGAAMRLRWMRHTNWAPVDGAGGSDAREDHDLVRIYQRDPEGVAGRAAAGDLLARYRRRVLVWCWRLMGDRETALDLAQDVLLSAYQNLGTYREQSRFGAWIFMIARNRCLSELRRRKVPLASEGVLALVRDHGPRPDEVLERKHLGEHLEELVRTTLDQQERDALWLRCYEGLPVETITRRLGIREASGARAVLQRARRKLRAALAAREGETR